MYTVRLDEIGKDDLSLAGGKGANLGELSLAGLPVPPGFVVTTRAYDAFVEASGWKEEIVALAAPQTEDANAFEAAAGEILALFSGGEVPAEIAQEIEAAYGELGEPPVAVRSSATAEDLAGASFAGQQETYLNVRGGGALMGAIKDCWASLWTARAMAYRARQGIGAEDVSLAVVVQRMVESRAAGVMFTANPANGRRDQASISAAWGLGESVVGGSVTPDSIVVDKESGRVISRETADKEVLTVYSGSGTEERPVPEGLRRQPVLDDATAAELARYGVRIEGHYGSPQDIEWALAEGDFFIVQARPITALPEPMADPPTDWSVPDPKGMYARASIVEQMPDPLTPLFADLVEDAVPRSLRKLMNEFFGEDSVGENDLGFPLINGYAYYYYRLATFWWLLLKMPSAVRLLTSSGGGQARWREYAHPRYAGIVEYREARPVDDMPAGDLLAGVEELLEAGAEYYTSVQTIIPLAAISEIMFTQFYERLVRREGDPPAQTFLLGFDSLPIRAEKSLHDLGTWTRDHPDLAGALESTPSEGALGLLQRAEPPAGVGEETWNEWRSRFQVHLDRYGHTVYNLDFATPVPADDPAPLFDTLEFYVRGEGQNPYERQGRTASRREAAALAVRSRLDAPRQSIFDTLLQWAQSVAPMREDALSDVGLAWPLMRRMLLELGRRLRDTGAIEKRSDVFWLRRDELRSAAESLDAGRSRLDSLADAVEGRKMLWRGQRRATPPQLLPEDSWFMVLQGLMPAASDEQTGDTIRGVGASQGRITAPANVLHGSEDFGRMRPGEVLVAGITTPAWTPLFAVASAVVTDVGGPLSHSSIVAREYGIPAVLGTGVATRRIRTGQTIQVDGDAGTVTLLDGTSEAAVSPATETVSGTRRSRPGAKKVVLLGLAAGALGAAAVWWRHRRSR
jgi:phosphohistidine swiveling domain-containing protein